MLELANYNVSFRQDGKFVISLEYLSHMEMEADDYRTDIFANPFGSTSDRGKSDPTYTIVKELRQYQEELTQLEFDLAAVQVRLADTKKTSKTLQHLPQLILTCSKSKKQLMNLKRQILRAEIEITKM